MPLLPDSDVTKYLSLLYVLMSSANKRPRSERLAAMSPPGTVDSRQPIKSVKAVASHINKGGTCQPTASPLKRAAGVVDTHSDLLAHMKTCAQVGSRVCQHVSSSIARQLSEKYDYCFLWCLGCFVSVA